MTNTRTYTYKVIQSSWGIWVSITADAIYDRTPSDSAIFAGLGVWLELDSTGVSLSSAELQMLLSGLRYVNSQINSAESERPVIIRISDISHNESDYQVEGLAAAIVGWVAAEFGVPTREPGVQFDKAQNRYVFDWVL